MKKGIILAVGLLVLFGGYIFLESKKKVKVMRAEKAEIGNEYSDVIKDAFANIDLTNTATFTEVNLGEEGIALQALKNNELTDKQLYYPDDGLRSLQEMLEGGGFAESLPSWDYLYSATEEGYINDETNTIQIKIASVDNNIEGAFVTMTQATLERQIAEMYLLSGQLGWETITYYPTSEFVKITYTEIGTLYVTTDRLYDGLKILVDIYSLETDQIKNIIEAIYVGRTDEAVLESKQVLTN